METDGLPSWAPCQSMLAGVQHFVCAPTDIGDKGWCRLAGYASRSRPHLYELAW